MLVKFCPGAALWAFRFEVFGMTELRIRSAKRIFCVLLATSIVLGLSLPTAWAQVWSRWHKDQGRESVLVGPTELLGQMRDDKLYLTEKEAIEMALRHNLDINVQRHNAIFTFYDAETLRGVYDPTATFGFNWDRRKTPTASVLSGGPSVTDVFTGYSFGYQQAFASGTFFEGSFTGNRSRTTNFFSSLVPSIDTNFQVSLRQNLLRGFRRIEQDYRIEIARNNRDITEQDFKQSVLEVIAAVQDNYWELEFAAEDIKVKEKSLQLANTVLEQNRARFEVGTAARLQVIESEAEAASRQEELIRARFNYRLNQDRLVRLISGYEDPREFKGEIVPADPVQSPAPLTQTFEGFLGQAAAERPELQKSELEIKNDEVNLEISRDKLKPTLDLTLAYQQFGLGGTQVIRDFSGGFINPPIIDIIPGGLGDSLDQLFTGGFYGYTLGLTLQIPIFNTESRAQNAQAQIALDRAELQRRSLRQGVALEIRDALTQIEMNQARLEASQATVRFAQERLEGEQAKFDVGLGTTRELIEAQRDLVQAQSVQIRAQVDLIKSHAALDKAVGRSLAKQNIELKDALRFNVR